MSDRRTFWQRLSDRIYVAALLRDPFYLYADAWVKWAKIKRAIQARYFTPEVIASPAPIRIVRDGNGGVLFASGPVLKLCPACDHVFQSFWNYTGGRYGFCGEYLCPGCKRTVAVLDQDRPGGQLTYAVQDRDGRKTLEIDYTAAYGLDGLDQTRARLGLAPDGDGEDTALADLLEPLEAAMRARGLAPDPGPFRLHGRDLPPEAVRWLGIRAALIG